MYSSKGDRITPFKSTLSRLPTYFISVFTISVSVAERLEKLQREFLCVGSGDELKYHLVHWRTVCSLLHSGGLGLRKLKMFDKALQVKWVLTSKPVRSSYGIGL